MSLPGTSCPLAPGSRVYKWITANQKNFSVKPGADTPKSAPKAGTTEKGKST